MREVVPGGAVIGFLGALGLLATLDGSVGLGVAGWVVGLGCAALLCVLLAVGLVRRGCLRLGPADRITLTRAVLACGVAALTADGFGEGNAAAPLVGISAVALLLDAVDGRVARRTATVSPLGARFDMESDAFLILALSVHVSQQSGWWVLAGGAARYILLAATWLAPWLARPVPPARWRKGVAGLQGVVLTVAAAGVLPPAGAAVLLAAALGLLATSFGTQVAFLWQLRPQRSDESRVAAEAVSVQRALAGSDVRESSWPT